MTDADMNDLREIVTGWDEAINSGDVDASLALYVEDNPMAMPPHAPLAKGKTEIRQVIEGLHALGKLTVRDELTGAVVSGDTAVMHGTFTLRVVSDEGEAMDDVGKWVCACRRQPDGSWKTLYNIWNSDNPLPE